MNERLVESNESAELRNKSFVDNLNLKAEEQPEKYESLKAKGQALDKLAHDFSGYIAELKTNMTASVDDAKEYESMDKGDFLDEHFFKGGKLKPEGEEFKSKIIEFREGVIGLLEGQKGMEDVIKSVKDKFNTDDVKRGAGKVEWLDHNYKGFPLVASLTKMTQIQSDIKTTESEILGNMLQGTLSSEVSMTNYTTLMETSKSAYFNGEKFDGQIVLGRTDASTKPSRVELTLDGRKLSDTQYEIEGGKVKLKVGTGGVGEHKIAGALFFAQDGEEVEVPVNSSFATVAKPNSATISADKMNVVYRGVKNPMTISFAGVPDNKVKASAQGLAKVSGSKYVMDATRIKGREITINVSASLPDGGGNVGDKATFRIKDLPKPTGTVRGEDGAVKMQRNSLEISTIGAKFDDFDFELPLRVTGFKFKVPGQPTINVSGSKLDSRAKAALRKAKRGSDVTIFDIKAKATGVSVILKKVSPIIVELTN
jgi:gliding motility-associated protein GldM